MAFNCACAAPYDQASRDISAHHGIAYWDDVALAVHTAGDQGEDVYVEDGRHWNERGHQLAADAIARHFRKEMTAGLRP